LSEGFGDKQLMRIFLTLLIVSLLALPAAAQMADRAELEEAARANALGVQPVATPSSLIDLSRLQWSHSYSLSYVSGSGNSASVGMLNTSMLYEFSPKLSLLLNVGVAHNAGALWGNGVTNATVLPGFVLDYHPSDKSFQEGNRQPGV
jgi:hypothetical protein